jgi:hypothetical protein
VTENIDFKIGKGKDENLVWEGTPEVGRKRMLFSYCRRIQKQKGGVTIFPLSIWLSINGGIMHKRTAMCTGSRELRNLG